MVGVGEWGPWLWRNVSRGVDGRPRSRRHPEVKLPNFKRDTNGLSLRKSPHRSLGSLLHGLEPTAMASKDCLLVLMRDETGPLVPFLLLEYPIRRTSC